MCKICDALGYTDCVVCGDLVFTGDALCPMCSDVAAGVAARTTAAGPPARKRSGAGGAAFGLSAS